MFDDGLLSLWRRFKLFLCPILSFWIGCYLPLGNTFFPPWRPLLCCSWAVLPVLPLIHLARNLQTFVLVFPLPGWYFFNLCVSSFHSASAPMSPQPPRVSHPSSPTHRFIPFSSCIFIHIYTYVLFTYIYIYICAFYYLKISM